MQHHRPIYALILRVLAAVILAAIFFLVKLATQSGIKVGEILFWRQMFAAPGIFLWLAVQQGGLARLKTKRLGAHALRGTIGMANMAILFTATSLLPLAEMTTLGFTTALFAVLIAGIVLREPVGPWRWAAVLMGFSGVLIIAQPGGQHVDPLGAALALFSSLVVVLINYQIRDLARTEEPISVVFWFGVFGALIGAVALPFYHEPHDKWQWSLLLGMGVLGLFGQLLLTASLRYASVSTVIVMDYSGLIWTTLAGWLAWGDVPPLTTWLGAPLIIGAGLIIVWRERRHARTVSPVAPVDAE